MRARVSLGLARASLLAGLLCLAGAAYDRSRMLHARLDKEAYYLFGRWLDAVWQVQVPLCCAGVGLIFIGALLFRSTLSHAPTR